MSDTQEWGGSQDQPTQTYNTEAEASTPAPQPLGDTTLRIVGFPSHREITVDDVVVTREPTDVPADKVADVFKAARAAGIRLEVLPQ